MSTQFFSFDRLHLLDDSAMHLMHHARHAQPRCSAWRALARVVVTPCRTRRSRHTQAHPTAFSRIIADCAGCTCTGVFRGLSCPLRDARFDWQVVDLTSIIFIITGNYL
jgi:hypothetical protein